MSERRSTFSRCGSHLATRGVLLAAAGVFAALTSAALHAAPVDVINAMRAAGCSRGAAAAAPLQHDNALDTAARELMSDDQLEGALGRAGYDATKSASFHVRGARTDDALRGLLASRYCDGISDPSYEDAGAFQRGDETWIVLAVRSVAITLEAGAAEQRVLALVNAARAESRRCGRDRFDPADPVTLSPFLTAAALVHSRDMARRGELGHDGSDGSKPAERVTRTGYTWSSTGENIAAGLRDADSVVAAWIDSPGHCRTLMGPQFTEMGIAFALAPGKNPAIYWTQVFGAPH